jgi:hypothetical protein
MRFRPWWALTIALLAPAPAAATVPYRVEMVGCVIAGFLFGESGRLARP